MADIIQLRRDTKDQWTLINPILAQGEIGIELYGEGLDKFKIGDAITPWNDLAYVSTSSLIIAGNGITYNETTGEISINDQYYTKTDLQSAGSAQVNWNNLSNVPDEFQDGNSSSFYYVQNTGSILWDITHNLNEQPTVAVIDTSGNEIEGSITHHSINNLSISFGIPVSGSAWLRT